MKTSSRVRTSNKVRLTRTDAFLLVTTAAASNLLFLVLVFLVPVLEKSLQGHPIPFIASLVISLGQLTRENIIVPVPIASVPGLLAVVGLFAKARGATTAGRALALLGIVSATVALAVIGACLLVNVKL
jgi:hypothetical protein